LTKLRFNDPVAVAGKPGGNVPTTFVILTKVTPSNIAKFTAPVIFTLDGPDNFEIVALNATVPALPVAKLAGVALGAMLVVVRQFVVGTTMPSIVSLSMVVLPPVTFVTVIL